MDLIKDKEYFSRGKRSIIYLGRFKNKKVIIKEAKKDIDAINVIKKEAEWLKLLNKYRVGPKLISFEENLVMEFIEGDLIIDYIEKNNKDKIKKIIKDVLNQCRILDKLKINKKEMDHPYKHIIIRNDKAYFIDFERCKKTLKPKNTTQFFDFLLSGKIKKILKKKNIKIDKSNLINVLKNYKKSYSQKGYDKLLGFI